MERGRPHAHPLIPLPSERNEDALRGTDFITYARNEEMKLEKG